ncbi:hypothetical protein EIP91_012149 [Steccherinum ochraceum]|uniref:Uncharacterized protein n=1 Tax=Steccherinum ochraceum TaxID=92696 RepID=A0A4R0RY90_9APHY|nr:hypothetical protein EIP91_012149 [Steccherinum ochraceum]
MAISSESHTFDPDFDICRQCFAYLPTIEAMVDHYFTFHQQAILTLRFEEEDFIFGVKPENIKRTHPKRQCYRCPVCEAGYDTCLEGVIELRRHILNDCDGVTTKAQVCRVCQRETSRYFVHFQVLHHSPYKVKFKKDLYYRRLSRTSQEDGMFRCLVCPFKTKLPWTMKLHASGCELRERPKGALETPSHPISGDGVCEPAKEAFGPSNSTDGSSRKRKPSRGSRGAGKQWRKSDALEPASKRQAIAMDADVTIDDTAQGANMHALHIPSTVAQSDVLLSPTASSPSCAIPACPPHSLSDIPPQQPSVSAFRAAPPPTQPSYDGCSFTPPPPPPLPSSVSTHPPSLPLRLSALVSSTLDDTRTGDPCYPYSIESYAFAKPSHSIPPVPDGLQRQISNPGFPDSYVYAFIATLASGAPEIALRILYMLGLAGITNQNRLVAFADFALRCPSEARDVMLTAGMSLLDWVALRRHLQSLESNEHIEDTKWQRDVQLEDFCDQCQPSLRRQVLTLTMLGITYDDIEFLARSPSFWSDTIKHLRLSTFTYPEILSFKRGLRDLTGITAPCIDSSPPLVSFFSTLKGPVKAKIEVMLLSSGIDSIEDLDVMSRLPEEELDGVMEIFSKAGLTFSECGALVAGLRRTRVS